MAQSDGNAERLLSSTASGVSPEARQTLQQIIKGWRDKAREKLDDDSGYVLELFERSTLHKCAAEVESWLTPLPPAPQDSEELEFLRTRDRHANEVIESRNRRLSEVAAQCDRLRAALVGLVGASEREELEQMEVVMRTLAAPDEDKAATINAIHALLADQAGPDLSAPLPPTPPEIVIAGTCGKHGAPHYCPNCDNSFTALRSAPLPPAAQPAVPNGRLHELKTWPPFFEAVRDGRKRFEIRRDDRGFRVGDTLWLREWDPRSEAYTGLSYPVVVTYLTASFSPEGYVTMSIEPAPPAAGLPPPRPQQDETAYASDDAVRESGRRMMEKHRGTFERLANDEKSVSRE